MSSRWTRAEFPHELVPGFADLGIAGLPYDGPGCPGRSALADGMTALELARRRAGHRGDDFDVQQDKIALRVVQNAEIHLRGVRVPEANRLANANSFEGTREINTLIVGRAITGESAFV